MLTIDEALGKILEKTTREELFAWVKERNEQQAIVQKEDGGILITNVAGAKSYAHNIGFLEAAWIDAVMADEEVVQYWASAEEQE